MNKYSFGKFKLIIIGLYRSLLSNTELFFDKLSIFLNYGNKAYANHVIIIAGDVIIKFNI